MKIGFIGAGNVGCSLGRYLKHNHIMVAGYYSRSRASAKEAAELTDTTQFDTLEEVVKTCDTLFLTVPDGQIQSVWDQVKDFPIEGKKICHCSGAMSAEVFSGIHELGAYGYSIHPMFPFNSKTIPYENIQKAFISVEGDAEKRDAFVKMFEGFGNPVKVLDGKNKTSYHVAAVMASNQVVALMELAVELLATCGFTEEQALQAVRPLAESNLLNILEAGPAKALTGPVERNDVQTVKKHLAVLDGEQKAVYRACSDILMHIAERKYPERDHMEMKEILED